MVKKNERIVKMHGVHGGGYNTSNSGSKQSDYSRSSTLPPSALLIRILPATFPPAFHVKRARSLHVARFRKAPSTRLPPFFLDFSTLMCLH